jgi:anaerobic magnesium-protoporphyrin IX monomethyl ester cyclase
MKIVLTHAYFIDDDLGEQKVMKPYPPLGLLYVSAFLRKNGYTPVVYDSTFSSIQDWKAFMLAEKPEVVFFYANLITKPVTIELLAFLEEQFKPITFAGGPDVTYNVENYLRQGLDALILGEGEQTALELLQNINNRTQWKEINGLAFLEDGKEVQTKPRSQIRDLSELGFPDREAIDFEKYLTTWDTYHGVRMANINTQRGCPYTCKWCSTAVYGQSYRRRPVEQVVDEIEYLQSHYGVNGLWFVDDVFTVSHKWIEALHAEFQARNIKIDFEIITRAERLNEKVLGLLKNMGCFRIWIGAESGSQKIIDAMDRRVKVGEVEKMINATKKAGMEAGTFIMLGYPGEGLKEIKETVNYLKKAMPNQLTTTIAYPIKGTALYEDVSDTLIIPDVWEKHTDRDLDFIRRHPKAFYRMGLRYLLSAVKAQQTKGSARIYLKSKSIFWLLLLEGMAINKR